ncbi:MAG: PAS domain S-box protein [Chitinophagaceae bacterium]
MNKLEELVHQDIDNLHSFSQPLLTLLEEKSLFARTKSSLLKFLNSLENGSAVDLLKEDLDKLRHDNLPSIGKTVITVSDLIMLLTAQKMSLLSLIPIYTTDTRLAIAVVQELERYFIEAQEISMNMLLQIHKEEQRKLAESEEKYKDLFDNANDLIHIVSPDGKILYVNNEWKHTLGYTQAELEGVSIYSFITESERDKYDEYRKRVIAGDTSLKPIETCFVTKTGEEVTVEGMISCKYEEGVPLYTQGILRNVTEQKQAVKKMQFYNEQLIEREENIQQLIQNAPDAVIVINDESTILLWNPKAEQIFGWQAEEVIGQPLADTIIPYQYREAHAAGMSRLLSTGESTILNKTVEITAYNKSGKEFYVSLTISRSRQKGKSLFISFIRDISAQKINEMELERKRNQLEKSNKELEQYAWLTSHDLKEPVRKILTYTNLLLMQYTDALSPAIKDTMEKINKVARRMNAQIEDLFTYSHLSDDNEFVALDLNITLKEVIHDLHVNIKAKNAQVLVNKLPRIKAVPEQMRQLFQNLITNSLKYSKTHIHPVIKLHSRKTDENRIEVVITDNGIGFEKEYSEKIFLLFQRLYSAEKYEGTGIGLAVCKKIAENHAGFILVDSEPGVGSTFIVNLPSIEAD